MSGRGRSWWTWQAHNPGADPLRAVLMRYGTGGGGAAAPAAAHRAGGRAPPLARRRRRRRAGRCRAAPCRRCADGRRRARRSRGRSPAVSLGRALPRLPPWPPPAPFWKTKPLERMTRAEWEIALRRLRPLLPAQAARRGHRRARLHQRRLPPARHRTPAAAPTTRTASAWVPDCVKLTPAGCAKIDWLPPSCAYRLLAEGKRPRLVASAGLRRPGYRASGRRLRARPRRPRARGRRLRGPCRALAGQMPRRAKPRRPLPGRSPNRRLADPPATERAARKPR